METQERYETTECPQNGTGCPPDDPVPVSRIRCRVEEITVQLKCVWEQEMAGDWVVIRAVPFNPTRLFAVPSDLGMPYGEALEQLIVQARQQAEQQG